MLKYIKYHKINKKINMFLIVKLLYKGLNKD